MDCQVGILYEDALSPELFDEFEQAVGHPQLDFKKLSRPSGSVYAGLEWLMPTVIVVYVARSYFDAFFKEMGKDHYGVFKEAVKKLYAKTAGPDVPEVRMLSTAGKVSERKPFSFFFSVVAQAPNGIRIKLLIPQPIQKDEYDAATSKFLEFVRGAYDGDIDPVTAQDFEDAHVVSNTLLVAYDVANKKLIPVDPLAGHRPVNPSAPSRDGG